MFFLHRPAEASIHQWLDQAWEMPLSYRPARMTETGMAGSKIPEGFVRDHTRTEIGQGRAAFIAAKEAFRRWEQFDLGWVRVANCDVPIAADRTVAVEAHTLGIWSVSISRILYVIDAEDRFGFGYGTTPLHVERGEERFLIEFDPASGIVHYDLLAVSQPRHWMAKLGYPYTRSQQRRFARESHLRMKRTVTESRA